MFTVRPVLFHLQPLCQGTITGVLAINSSTWQECIVNSATSLAEKATEASCSRLNSGQRDLLPRDAIAHRLVSSSKVQPRFEIMMELNSNITDQATTSGVADSDLKQGRRKFSMAVFTSKIYKYASAKRVISFVKSSSLISETWNQSKVVLCEAFIENGSTTT